MAYGDGRKLVRTRLARIADSISAEFGSYSTNDVLESFNKEISELKKPEIDVLINVGARVLAGRLPVTKSNVNWKSPYIAGLNLSRSIRLRLQDEDKKFRSRNYPIQNVTPKMIGDHEKGLSESGKLKKDSLSHLERLRALIDKMTSEGYEEDTPLSEYRGE